MDQQSPDTASTRDADPKRDDHSEQQPGAAHEQSTQVVAPPQVEPQHDKDTDYPRPATHRREGVVCDPDVPGGA